jgi:type IV secretory pathway VirB10-like protein
VRRIVLIILVVAVVGIAGFLLLRPKPKAAPKKQAASADSSEGTAPAAKAKSSAAPAKASKRRGTSAKASMKAMTKEERRAQMKRIRDEERKRKRELKRQEREKRKALRQARRARGKRKSGKRGQSLYVVKAIVSLGDESYALVDSRRVKVGDIVMGRRVVAIEPDRLAIEAFGRRTVVRVGESLIPNYGYGSK